MFMSMYLQAVVLEGKYQKRKVEAVAREYRRWRLHHREKFVRARTGIIFTKTSSLYKIVLLHICASAI